MEGILKVTPEQLISTASEFSSKAGTINSLTGEMTSKVSALASAWEGEAATAYITKFNGLQDDIEKMVAMVQEHSKDLNDMAEVYSSAEKQNVSDFEGLSADVIV